MLTMLACLQVSSLAASAMEVPSVNFDTALALEGSIYQHVSGSNVYVNSLHAGKLRLRVTATSASGIENVTFPIISATGWSAVSELVDTTWDNDYYTADYSWVAGAAEPNPTLQTITAQAGGGGGTVQANFNLHVDTSAPAGGTIDASKVAEGIKISYEQGMDTGAGIASVLVQRRIAVHLGSSCGVFGGWGGIATSVSPFVDMSVTPGFCYQYRLTSRDMVGNESIPVEDPNIFEFSPVLTDDTAPAFGPFSVVPLEGKPWQHWDGTTLWFNPSFVGSINLRVFVGDAQTGVQSVSLNSFASGVSANQLYFTAGPYETQLSWIASAGSSVAQVTATNGAGGSSSIPFYMTADTLAPSGMSVEAAPKFIRDLVPVTVSGGIDTGSGLAGWKLQRRSADIKLEGCGQYSEFRTVAEGAGDRVQQDKVELGTCNEWRVVSYDFVGNESQSEPVTSIVQPTIRGTNKNDIINGTVRADIISGLAGNDRIGGGHSDDILGGGVGDDQLFGGAGADRLIGGPGKDYLNGGSGDDLLEGGAGNDRLVGSDGNDTILAGPGNDTVFGEDGDDLIGARDGKVDRIYCGSGDDTVIADRFDKVAASCENVRRGVFKPKRRR